MIASRESVFLLFVLLEIVVVDSFYPASDGACATMAARFSASGIALSATVA
jgi:hypothetical protein